MTLGLSKLLLIVWISLKGKGIRPCVTCLSYAKMAFNAVLGSLTRECGVHADNSLHFHSFFCFFFHDVKMSIADLMVSSLNVSFNVVYMSTMLLIICFFFLFLAVNLSIADIVASFFNMVYMLTSDTSNIFTTFSSSLLQLS